MGDRGRVTIEGRRKTAYRAWRTVATTWAVTLLRHVNASKTDP